MNEDSQQSQESSGSDQIPERIEPIFQTEDIITRSLDDDFREIIYVEGNIIMQGEMIVEGNISALCSASQREELEKKATRIIPGDLLLSANVGKHAYFIAEKDVIQSSMYFFYANDCYRNFITTLDNLKILAQERNSKSKVDNNIISSLDLIYNNMIYSYLFSIYEEYIMSILLVFFDNYPKAFVKYYKPDSNEEKQITYQEESEIRAMILKTPCGSLKRISSLFNSLFAIELPDEDETFFLQERRHAILHRGGQDINGDIKFITSNDIESAMNSLKNCVKNLNDKFVNYENKQTPIRKLYTL